MRQCGIENNIIIGFDERIESSNLNSIISVTGSLSGIHNGKILLVEDKKKLIFFPEKPFEFNETINLKLNQLKTFSNINSSLIYSFQTQNRKIEVDYNEYMLNESGNLKDN